MSLFTMTSQIQLSNNRLSGSFPRFAQMAIDHPMMLMTCGNSLRDVPPRRAPYAGATRRESVRQVRQRARDLAAAAQWYYEQSSQQCRKCGADTLVHFVGLAILLLIFLLLVPVARTLLSQDWIHPPPRTSQRLTHSALALLPTPSH